jgi:lipopolysaccharide/colanic/teichoic acid biosynthesis glycosyltransferase
MDANVVAARREQPATWNSAHAIAEQVLRAAGWYAPVKAGLDFALALVLLVLAAPAILVTALVVKLTSSGPAFYRQTRTGRFGQPYLMYKIRTMIHDCERLTGPCWSRPGDTRITRVGRFLRRTHLDELPQLWNVLRGEMSLVGPRPERPEIIYGLEHAIPNYRARLRVRPGITGLAQLRLPPDTDVASVRRKVIFDLCYIKHVGLRLDLIILLRTGLGLLGSRGLLMEKLLPMPAPAPMDPGAEAVKKASVRQPPGLIKPQPASQPASM